MIVYWDTSALVAVYLRDACSRQAAKLVSTQTKPISSWLCFAETLAALRAALDSQRITSGIHRAAVSAFEDDWAKFHRMPLNAKLAPELRRLLRFHGLRGADATHLASALVVHRHLAGANQHFVFACHDRRLAEAAQTEGLQLGWPLN